MPPLPVFPVQTAAPAYRKPPGRLHLPQAQRSLQKLSLPGRQSPPGRLPAQKFPRFPRLLLPAHRSPPRPLPLPGSRAFRSSLRFLIRVSPSPASPPSGVSAPFSASSFLVSVPFSVSAASSAAIMLSGSRFSSSVFPSCVPSFLAAALSRRLSKGHHSTVSRLRKAPCGKGNGCHQKDTSRKDCPYPGVFWQVRWQTAFLYSGKLSEEMSSMSASSIASFLRSASGKPPGGRWLFFRLTGRRL